MSAKLNRFWVAAVCAVCVLLMASCGDKSNKPDSSSPSSSVATPPPLDSFGLSSLTAYFLASQEVQNYPEGFCAYKYADQLFNAEAAVDLWAIDASGDLATSPLAVAVLGYGILHGGNMCVFRVNFSLRPPTKLPLQYQISITPSPTPANGLTSSYRFAADEVETGLVRRNVP